MKHFRTLYMVESFLNDETLICSIMEKDIKEAIDKYVDMAYKETGCDITDYLLDLYDASTDKSKDEVIKHLENKTNEYIEWYKKSYG